MPGKYVEKLFLSFIALSFLLHVAGFTLVYFLPQEKKPLPPEPYMVELSELPEIKGPPAAEEKKAKRLGEERRRVARETAPKGEREREKVAALPAIPPRPAPSPPSGKPLRGALRVPAPERERAGEPARGEGVFKPRERGGEDLARLFPSADRLARLEEGYRKKYGPEVEEGGTRFLNTDDIQFGSFLRRFETAVYGVWRYPSDAARLGLEGVTAVKITFNREGRVVDVQLLESSGSKILDDEVLRTLHALGPIGSFPKNYDKDSFHLIAFFQYGIIRGTSRGTLH